MTAAAAATSGCTPQLYKSSHHISETTKSAQNIFKHRGHEARQLQYSSANLSIETVVIPSSKFESNDVVHWEIRDSN